MKTLKQASAATKILAVDIGGSNIKATLLNEHGQMIADYKKLPTPSPATPGAHHASQGLRSQPSVSQTRSTRADLGGPNGSSCSR